MPIMKITCIQNFAVVGCMEDKFADYKRPILMTVGVILSLAVKGKSPIAFYS